MTEPSAAGVYHDTDLPGLVNAHLAGCVLVEDLVDNLDLSVVVACSQSSELNMSSWY